MRRPSTTAKSLYVAPRVLPHACTNLLQTEILNHPEYDEMRRTYPAYLWGYSARFRDARVANNLTPQFYEKERERLAEFDGRTQGHKTTQPNASPTCQDEVNAPLRQMSLQPVPHRSESDEPEGLYMPEGSQAGPSKRKFPEGDENADGCGRYWPPARRYSPRMSSAGETGEPPATIFCASLGPHAPPTLCRIRRATRCPSKRPTLRGTARV